MPRGQRRIAIGYSRILSQRALTRIDDDERPPLQFRCVKAACPGLVTARSQKLRNMAVTRIIRIDPAMIDREILPHLEMGAQVRPHRSLVPVTQRNHKVEGLDVAD